MSGYVVNIEEKTKNNDYFRQVLYTAKNSQLVVMSLNPKEDIGEEVHGLDQFLRVESGEGEAVLDDKSYRISGDYAIVVPAGTKHNIINTSDTEKLKLYTVYSPPEHRLDVIHKTKPVAEADDEHFDGRTSE